MSSRSGPLAGPRGHIARQAMHFVRNRPRLLSGLALGAAAWVLLPSQVLPATRALIAWNAAVWCYLLLAARLMMTASAARVRGTCQREDPGAVAVLALMSFAAVASLAAILLELAAAKSLPIGVRLLHYGLTAGTLFGSWLFLGTIFAFHYARMYYRAGEGAQPLRFPGDGTDEPDYWDFLYFSFTISAGAQTSDVAIQTRSMRKAVLGHCVLGFIFNAAIIGMTINVAAGLVGS